MLDSYLIYLVCIMKTQQAATFIGSIAILLWGSLALLTQLAGTHIPPFQLMAMSFAIAFLFMLGRWLLQGHQGIHYLRTNTKSWLLGVSGLFGFHFCYFLAMDKSPAAEVSLIAYLWPIFIVLLASLLPGERLYKQQLAGAGLALLGCFLLLRGDSNGFAQRHLLGYLLALASAIIWALYSVAGRLIPTVNSETIGWYCGATAALALCCHLYWEQTQWPHNPQQWLALIGLGLGPVGAAFVCWDYGIKHGQIQLLAVLSYAAPLISIVLLTLAGSSEMRLEIALACLLIVAGSLCASRVKAPTVKSINKQ